MKALYFGTYERGYPRNAQVISCLRAAGVDVVERHAPLWESRHKLTVGTLTAVRALRTELRLARSAPTDADVVIVGYPGHLDMWAARRVAGDRPVVFNPLVSLEDTIVGDRGLVSSSSARARVLCAIDEHAFRAADLVVADTAAHGAYFARRFGLSDKRVAVCLVGAEDRIFTPGERASSTFTALFVGKLIPLHGLETILEAARICEEIPFRIVGSGQLDEVLTHPPPNVTWERWIAYERLPGLYRTAGCALGIFGRSKKATRVIPNKAFQALATQTPLVTADTPAARELLMDGRDVLFVPPDDAQALAAAVRRLSGDRQLRDEIGRRGRATYVEHASEPVLGARWRALLEDLVAARAA